GIAWKKHGVLVHIPLDQESGTSTYSCDDGYYVTSSVIIPTGIPIEYQHAPHLSEWSAHRITAPQSVLCCWNWSAASSRPDGAAVIPSVSRSPGES
ncbi:MAG: hypothetical protein U0K19_00775, partial [Bifidobacteriaceae bacterium]|nr:hypothetical protein [Bifidobacteriaceae bacterium]